MEELVVSDEALKSVTRAIYKNHGIDFRHYEPKSLKRRVASAMRHFKLAGVQDLKNKLVNDDTFIFSLMDELSVGLTSMFRDPHVWQKINRMLRTDFKNKDISLWHAGCSTGEEVFTMGIAMRESGYNGKMKAWASDISSQSLEYARAGVYPMLKIDEYVKSYKEYSKTGSLLTYGKTVGHDFHMDLSLTDHVMYEYHNLITDPFPEKFDIILCRNVMIYFDSRTKKDLFIKFHNALSPGGLFIIGFYDASLPFIDDQYFKPWDADNRIFQKVG